MKYRFNFLLTLLMFLFVNSQAQTRKDKREQSKYLTSYEKKTLNNNELPVMMPYNRWIDPAGEQIYFGDTEFENHALDCAVSPDGKWKLSVSSSDASRRASDTTIDAGSRS